MDRKLIPLISSILRIKDYFDLFFMENPKPNTFDFFYCFCLFSMCLWFHRLFRRISGRTKYRIKNGITDSGVGDTLGIVIATIGNSVIGSVVRPS